MAKSKEEAEKANGLEIISIGYLYSGTWDKKYWSSSRGKDRYPYPVGYHALRAYNESIYKMEIQEGPQGPLFVITSPDGNLCFGQTPDIAWEKFQKKGCSRMKVWHGKRFSCKIDGIEFFGFRNPFVQRLLRELVANVNGIAERNPLSSSFCNGASSIDHNNQCQDVHTGSDLLEYLAKPQVTGKQSKRHDIISYKPFKVDGLKRKRAGDLSCNVDPSNLTHGNHKQRASLPPCSISFHLNQDAYKIKEAVPEGVKLKYLTGEEHSRFSAEGGLLLKSVDYPDHCREKTVLANEESKPTSSGKNKPTFVVRNPCLKEKSLERLPDTEVQGFDFPVPSEFKPVDISCPEESQNVQDVYLCVPDTLDFVQDNTTNIAPSTCDKITFAVKEELLATNKAFSEELVNKSHPVEETESSNSNVSSERSDFDSVGQDIAKSMMTVLLPQAIPLLKKPSSKKKKTTSPSGNLLSTPTLYEENNEACYFVDIQSPGVDHLVIQSSEHTKSVIEKFNSDQSGDYVTNQLIFPSNNVEADQPSLGKDASLPNGGEQFVNAGCMSASKKILTEVNQSKNLGENTLGAEIDSRENVKTASDCNQAVGTSDATVGDLGSSVHLEQKDTVIEARPSEISNISGSQVPKKVYARKKVSNTEPTKRKHPQLLETVVCREFIDGCASETTRALLDSEAFKLSSSVSESHKKEMSSADTRNGGNLHGLETHNATVTPNSVSCSWAPLKSQNQAFVYAREGQNTSNLFVPSMPSVEIPEGPFEERLVGQENTLDVKGPRSQKQGTEFCHNKTFIANENDVKDNLELKIHRNLDLKNELEDIEFLGCYFHPMPVLSLLLSRKGNEIYICALCGLLVDEDKTLFLYKLAIEEPSKGCPCFVGHTSLSWPSVTDIFGREISFERSGLQLTPDGQSVVLIGSARTPYCREGRRDCLCSACASDSFDNSMLKIVQVKTGYVSVLLKLRTTDSLQCILVCEPDQLVAAGESRRLHMWTMNSSWSAPAEEFTIPSNDCISPCIMELKRIPKCASLVIGHNGFGEFTLWNISKRIFVSRFSAPTTSVHQFFPISLFSWPQDTNGFGYSNVSARINRLMDATKMWFSEHSKNLLFSPSDGEDIAIWFLVSTVPEFDAPHDFESSHCMINQIGCWRLALLVKNKMIFGSTLDARATAIGTSAGHGIIGTCDGLVYMWELFTGKKLRTLHKFKGGSISCIATDNSGSGVLVVVDDRGQLLVYKCPR